MGTLRGFTITQSIRRGTLALSRPLLVALSLIGCQVALDVEREQCEVDQDCVGLLGRSYMCSDEQVCVQQHSSPPEDAGSGDASTGSDPKKWACLKQMRRVVIPQSGRVISMRLSATDFVDLTSPPGLTARACNPTDVPCNRPLIEGVVPDDEGYLVFAELPHGFQGYVQLSAPDFVDSLRFTNRPYTGNEMPEGTTMLTVDSLNSISKGGGEAFDESKGVVLVLVYDCEGHAASGVRIVQLDASSDEHPFYFESTLPDRDRETTVISTQLTRTMAPLAVGGYSRVNPGYVTMVGVLEETGEEIGRVTVQVRALTISFAELNAGY